MAGARRLAAIVAADVAGFSRLMGADEAATFAALKAHRHAVQPILLSHGGRIANTAGDGLLIEFGSAIAALQAMLAVQTLMAERNADVGETRRMLFRVGVHLGEVIDDDGDIFGDAVNVAARLQAEAAPGGIVLSAEVRAAVRNGFDVPLVELGPRRLKNIAEPVVLWQVACAADATPAPAAASPLARRAIAVLPFDNMSADAGQVYFADGITEDIITALSRIAGLRVIARNSTFAYKGAARDVRLIAAELDARYVLEGSVRLAGERVRITAQLIDAGSGEHLWAERYDRRLDDVFAVQDEITAQIAGRVAPEVWRSEGRRVTAHHTSALDAWDLHLRALAHYHLATKVDFEEAERLCLAGLERDADYAPLWCLLADCRYQLIVFGMRRASAEAWTAIHHAAQQAYRLDPDDPTVLAMFSAELSMRGEVERAGTVAEAAAGRFTWSAACQAAMAQARFFAGRYDEAIAGFEAMIALGPSNPIRYQPATMLAFAHYLLGQYEAALAWADDALAQAPLFGQALGIRAATLARLGREAEATAAAARFAEAFGGVSATAHCRSFRWHSADDVARYRDGLIAAGVPDWEPV